MKDTLLYRLSMILTIVFTIIAFFTVFAWMGLVINGVGRLPVLALVPWQTLGLVALTALNCTVRARLIKGRKPMDTAG